MWHSRPPRDPPLHGKCHLKFPFWFFDYLPNPEMHCSLGNVFTQPSQGHIISYLMTNGCLCYVPISEPDISNLPRYLKKTVIKAHFPSPRNWIWSSAHKSWICLVLPPPKKKRKSQQLNRQNNSLWIGKVAEFLMCVLWFLILYIFWKIWNTKGPMRVWRQLAHSTLIYI